MNISATSTENWADQVLQQLDSAASNRHPHKSVRDSTYRHSVYTQLKYRYMYVQKNICMWHCK